MVISAAAVCIILLGTIFYAEAAPLPATQDLENYVEAAKYLYKRLSQAQDVPFYHKLFSPSSNINFGTDTAVNGNDNFNFDANVHGLFVSGK